MHGSDRMLAEGRTSIISVGMGTNMPYAMQEVCDVGLVLPACTVWLFKEVTVSAVCLRIHHRFHRSCFCSPFPVSVPRGHRRPHITHMPFHSMPELPLPATKLVLRSSVPAAGLQRESIKAAGPGLPAPIWTREVLRAPAPCPCCCCCCGCFSSWFRLASVFTKNVRSVAAAIAVICPSPGTCSKPKASCALRASHVSTMGTDASRRAGTRL